MPDVTSSPAAATTEEMQVIICVHKAELNRSFESFGRMDPFVIVEWVSSDGTEHQIARTFTDWDAHMQPRWDYTCRAQLFVSKADMVDFQVMEDNKVTKHTFCGCARMTIGELLGNPASYAEELIGPSQNLPLILNKKEKDDTTGSITVQLMLMPGKPTNNLGDEEKLTPVDSAIFHLPVKRKGVSGGTAPFFTMILKDPEGSKGKEYYIGKDLSHATDEVHFYEEVLRLKDEATGSGRLMLPLLSYCFEYLGVCRCPVEGEDPKKKPKDLLVLRNLFDGCAHLRLLDIKIGTKTADAGWQGKSRSAAWKQSIIDGLTNSSCEGYRLEGFDGLPPVLESMDPLLDFGKGSKKTKKKAFRVMLQRLTGAELLMHFLDTHQEPKDIDDSQLEELLSPTELGEIVLRTVVSKLANLSVACRLAPAPQKWIGSSVALGYDAGRLPPRSSREDEVNDRVRVQIFDWGRSELNTLERQSNLSPEQQADRKQFWHYYVGGIDRLSWEAARAYQHRFSNAVDWTEAVLTVFDFDSATKNDFLGRCTVELGRDRNGITLPLTDRRGAFLKNSSVTYSVRWRAFPADSTLKGAWCITVHRATKVPVSDRAMGLTTSDPFVEIVATSADGTLKFRMHSAVKIRNLEPEWEETFELPVAKDPNLLDKTLSNVDKVLSGMPQSKLFPVEETATRMTAWRSNRRNSSSSTQRSLEQGSEVCEQDEDAILVWEDMLDEARGERMSRKTITELVDSDHNACKAFFELKNERQVMRTRSKLLVSEPSVRAAIDEPQPANAASCCRPCMPQRDNEPATGPCKCM